MSLRSLVQLGVDSDPGLDSIGSGLGGKGATGPSHWHCHCGVPVMDAKGQTGDPRLPVLNVHPSDGRRDWPGRPAGAQASLGGVPPLSTSVSASRLRGFPACPQCWPRRRSVPVQTLAPKCILLR